MKELHVGLTGINPFCHNKGVAALTYSALYLLKQLERPERPFRFFLILDDRTRRECDFSVADYTINTPVLQPINFCGWKNFLKTCLVYGRLRNISRLKTYLKLDCVLDLGFGDSFSDIYGQARFDLVNGPKRMFHRMNIPQLILPQTIGPFTDPKIAAMARTSIERSQIVLTRDRQSYDYVKIHTTQKNVHELIDVAFFMPYHKQVFPSGKINVGVNVSALLWNGGYTHDNQFHLKSDYRQLIQAVLSYFTVQTDVQLYLVPHVPIGDGSVEDDYALSEKLAAEYPTGQIVTAPIFDTPIAAKNYISGLDFFAGARMHTCVAAFSSGVPVFPMSYSRKFNGLFTDTLNYPVLGDLLVQSQQSLLAALADAFHERDRLRLEIDECLNRTLPEKCLKLLRQLDLFFQSVVSNPR
ncbi:MAG: polysaccharide pyruvyl transferase family protein [Victivallales bacterium]